MIVRVAYVLVGTVLFAIAAHGGFQSPELIAAGSIVACMGGLLRRDDREPTLDDRVDAALALLAQEYVDDRLTIEEFEARVAETLDPKPVVRWADSSPYQITAADCLTSTHTMYVMHDMYPTERKA